MIYFRFLQIRIFYSLTQKKSSLLIILNTYHLLDLDYVDHLQEQLLELLQQQELLLGYFYQVGHHHFPPVALVLDYFVPLLPGSQHHLHHFLLKD